MEEKELNVNEIVKIESMAVIKQQLDKVESFIDEKVKDIPKVLEQLENMSDEEKEAKKQEIKKYKQYLNKIENELEGKRKEIKKKVNEPYEEYNTYYTNGAKVKLDENIEKLDKVIKDIEYKQLKGKEIELVEFANQHIIDNNLESIIKYEDIGLNITLSASIKSLKEQILSKIEKIANDIKLIEQEEYKEELLIEYRKNNFDYVDSKIIVNERHRKIEELKKQQEEKLEQEKQEEKIVERVEETIEEIKPPIEVIEDDEIITVQFTVTGTKEKIKKIKDLILELGVEYK